MQRQDPPPMLPLPSFDDHKNKLRKNAEDHRAQVESTCNLFAFFEKELQTCNYQNEKLKQRVRELESENKRLESVAKQSSLVNIEVENNARALLANVSVMATELAAIKSNATERDTFSNDPSYGFFRRVFAANPNHEKMPDIFPGAALQTGLDENSVFKTPMHSAASSPRKKRLSHAALPSTSPERRDALHSPDKRRSVMHGMPFALSPEIMRPAGSVSQSPSRVHNYTLLPQRSVSGSPLRLSWNMP